MKAYIFDFDGTIGKTHQYHQSGWKCILDELMIKDDIGEIFPDERDLYERYDSYRRIKKRFLEDEDQIKFLRLKFGKKTDLAREIMDLKESYAISSILKEEISETLKNMATNLAPFLDQKYYQRHLLGVVSSSRKLIISTFLDKVGILNYFDFIIGEEDMYCDGTLYDKPHPRAISAIKDRLDNVDEITYFGDDPNIDKAFAKNIKANFYLVDCKTNYLSLKNDKEDNQNL